MQVQLKTKYANCLCDIKVSFYEDSKRPALLLTHAETGEPVMTATVNPHRTWVKDPHVTFIKDYSENEGVLDCLINNNIVILEKGMNVPSGFVTLYGVKLCKELADEYDAIIKQSKG